MKNLDDNDEGEGDDKDDDDVNNDDDDDDDDYVDEGDNEGDDDVDEGDDVFDLLLPSFAFYYVFLVISATWSIILQTLL